jgi:hypothetical protein
MGMLILALTFGLILTGCDLGNGTTDGSDAALNGTWTDDKSGVELKLTNGSLEALHNGNVVSKGTYTTSGSNITIKITHSRSGISEVDTEGKSGREYLSDFFSTKTEFMTAMEKMYKEAGFSGEELSERLAEDEEKADEEILAVFTPQTVPYSINGNTLTIDETTYTKK